MRTVLISGMDKQTLLDELRRNAVELNELGQFLFEDDRFVTTDNRIALQTAEVSVCELGFPDGATTEELIPKAFKAGLGYCPLELGPHLRLQYMDQPEGSLGYSPSKNQAPPGSITVVSAPLDENPDIPKGFYLRKINGVLWLRGYVSDMQHVWSPDDKLLFCLQ